MTQYNCVKGQSWTDVVMNTYGSMDHYIKLLNDNGLEPDGQPVSGQPVMWDETLVADQAILQQITQNKTIYATFDGVIVPPTETIDMSQFTNVLQFQYLSTEDNLQLVTIPDLQHSASNVNPQVIQIIRNITPILNNEFTHDPVAGTIRLANGVAKLNAGEKLFILYKVTVTYNNTLNQANQDLTTIP